MTRPYSTVRRSALRVFLPALACLLSLLLPTLAHAATRNVPYQYPTIQAGVNAAVSGDTVLVADGIYSGPGNRDIDFRGKNLSVTSQHGAASTIIDCGGYKSTDGSGNHRGFYIHSGETAAAISGFTIKNGYEVYISGIDDSGSGGGVCNSGIHHDTALTLTGCTVSGNTAFSGGGVSNSYGTLTLTGCTVSGNTAGGGGGGGLDINDNGSRTITLTNCTISGNTASSGGGGVIIIGTASLTNCTISGNTGSYGGGVYNDGIYHGTTLTLTNCTILGNTGSYGGGVYNSGTTALTNDVIYGNTGGAVVNNSQAASAATATYSDVPGGYPGTGNISADPLFVNAASGNFRLQPNSPCLEAGTSTGAPNTDKDGTVRPAPPSIGAYELLAAHLLWNNVNGAASVWNLSDANPSASYHLYGPYPGWTARAIAEGTNGMPRLLWTNTSGQAALWNLADANPAATPLLYGPYAGWTAKSLAVGPDNVAHILWNNKSGQSTLWNVDSTGGYALTYVGPYTGWSATAISYGPDGKERLLWNNVSGAVCLWNLADANPSASSYVYGPFGGWTAKALAVGPDNTPQLLWNNTSGQSTLWSVDSAGGYTFTYAGPYSGWSGTAIAVGGDNRERLLWNNVNGQVSVWNLSDPNPVGSSLLYGPYSGWSAVAISVSQ